MTGMGKIQLKSLILNFINNGAVWIPDSGEDAVVKMTSRMYENWVFMRLVEAFRKLGLDFVAWEQMLGSEGESRFKIDFYRGLGFAAQLTARKWLLIRYEPWILPRNKASEKKETVFRGGEVEVPWSPDILIECLLEHNGIYQTIYAIVIDCKYTRKIKGHHWDAVSKYLEIRSMGTKRQVVKQLWIAYPGDNATITCEDPALSFSKEVPTCGVQESIIGKIHALPCGSEFENAGSGISAISDVFNLFASGTARFLRGSI